ncbi:methyltransferase [Novosphingobium bradum]|uniref:Methyltransferase n=1 Tax=Novosphingobium bradum TaxID=1737444 RepID=A0ABV7IRH8_9SPHN
MSATESLARRARIGAAFAAAGEYDRHARVQHQVAERLALRIGACALPRRPRVLEIGCGTGFLTAQLVRHLAGGSLLVTDLARPMVERCRARIGEAPGRTFRVLDGEHGEQPPEAPFDLITASLAFQWFDDLACALARLAGWLAPGGVLAFTTLADGTFAEWHEAHAGLGLVAGTPAFPDVMTLSAMVPPGLRREIMLQTITEPQGSARAFLHGLKAIGAGTAAPGHQPLAPGALRRAMARFEKAGAMATYEVASCVLVREES